MAQYISKSAIVAEIERRIRHYNNSAKEFGDEGYNDNVLMEQCKANACKHILSFIDTLEVKEGNLKKEISDYLTSYHLHIKDGGEELYLTIMIHLTLCVMLDILQGISLNLDLKHRKENEL